MITYTKMENGKGIIYQCVYNTLFLGTLEEGVDGFYVFWPIQRCGYWDGPIMMDLANNLAKLNEDWAKRIAQEIDSLLK